MENIAYKENDMETESYESLEDLEKDIEENIEENIPNFIEGKNGDSFLLRKTLKENPLLTRDEEKALFDRYQKGDVTARDEIFNHNIGLVYFIANKFRGYLNASIAYDDLMQEGSIGLMRAISSFDASKDVKFSTYAVFWIFQRIHRYISNNATTIRVPVHALEKIRKMKALIRNQDEEGINYDEELTEILTQFGATSQEFLAYRCLTTKSLNTYVSEDKDTEFQDMIASPDSTEKFVTDEIYRKFLMEKIKPVLTDREFIVLEKRFGLNGVPHQTLESVGKDLGVTRERIRQIETKALRKLRAKYKRGNVFHLTDLY